MIVTALSSQDIFLFDTISCQSTCPLKKLKRLSQGSHAMPMIKAWGTPNTGHSTSLDPELLEFNPIAVPSWLLNAFDSAWAKDHFREQIRNG